MGGVELREAYAVLDLPPGSSPERIREAYRQLVAVWHPDRFAHNPELQASAAEKLKRINEAYALVLAAESGAAQSDGPAFPYRDEDCRYLGDDVRLRPVSMLELRERRAVVEVTPAGITLATLTGTGQAEQVVSYSAGTVLWIRKGDRYWGRIVPAELTWPFPDTHVSMRVSDPEGIVKGFDIRLKFRNAYFAELFRKRVTSALCLALPSKPAPKPPAPTPAAPKPAPAALVSPPRQSVAMTQRAQPPSKPLTDRLPMAAGIAVPTVLVLAVIIASIPSRIDRPAQQEPMEQQETEPPERERSPQTQRPPPRDESAGGQDHAGDTPSAHSRGVEAFNAREFLASAELFTLAINEARSQGERSLLLERRGVANLYARRLQEAFADLDAAVLIAPRTASAYYWRAVVRAQLGMRGVEDDYAMAIRLDRAIRNGQRPRVFQFPPVEIPRTD